MDPHNARAALDQIHAREEQVVAEVKRWPAPWFAACFAIAVGAMMSTGDLDGLLALWWIVGGTAALVVLGVVFAVRFGGYRVVLHQTRYSRAPWIWLLTFAVPTAICIGGPPALAAVGFPLPYIGSGVLLAIAIYATAVATTRAIRPGVPGSSG